MHKNMEWVKKYYSDEQLADLAKRDDPELRSQAERDWARLIADAEAALGEDPAGEQAQAIATRWTDLVHAFTGGDPGIRNGLQNLFADRANWPANFEMPYSEAVWTFIAKAVAARKGTD